MSYSAYFWKPPYILSHHSPRQQRYIELVIITTGAHKGSGLDVLGPRSLGPSSPGTDDVGSSNCTATGQVHYLALTVLSFDLVYESGWTPYMSWNIPVSRPLYYLLALPRVSCPTITLSKGAWAPGKAYELMVPLPLPRL